VNYLHKAMFIPTKSALLQAVKNGHLITWPGLTEQAINKHLKLMPATSMGHMNQRRKNIRSTSKNPVTSDIEDESVTPVGSGGGIILCMQYWSTKGNFIQISPGNIRSDP
jgi:hypothetical protein